MFFINSSTGWITGEDGIILKTTTGGVITGIGNNYQYSPDEVLSVSNYPNPFNYSTSIKLKIPSDKINSDNSVELIVYDALGNEIYFRIYKLSSLNSENNYYKLVYDATGFASGMYFYKIKFNGYSSVKKMILLK
ncbi:MAG: T9SS type A sorting domain-containing protein [Ignavibacteria bacterium]|nr:T9SS type A sorting domain-containing protein [Ignavibacteria bacterium]